MINKLKEFPTSALEDEIKQREQLGKFSNLKFIDKPELDNVKHLCEKYVRRLLDGAPDNSYDGTDSYLFNIADGVLEALYGDSFVKWRESLFAMKIASVKSDFLKTD